MALITYFKAQQTCLRCKRSGTAWVWSKLGDRGVTYVEGDRVASDIPQEDIDDVCLKVRDPQAGEPTRILLSWDCEHCGLTNLAQVALADGCVRSIETIELTPETLDQLHYIAEGISDMLETIIGEQIYGETGVRADWLPALRKALEAGKRW